MSWRNKTYPYLSQLRKVTCLIYLLFGTMFLRAQEPPPHLRLSYGNSKLSGDSLSSLFEFRTFMSEGNQFQPYGDNEEWVKDRLMRNKGDNFICVFLYGETVHLPLQGDLFRLSLKRKTTNETMNIFVRVSFDVRYSEEIAINISSFQEGTYYMDMCSSRNKYQIPPGNSGEAIINIGSLDKHSISIKKLKKLLKSYSCVDLALSFINYLSLDKDDIGEFAALFEAETFTVNKEALRFFLDGQNRFEV